VCMHVARILPLARLMFFSGNWLSQPVRTSQNPFERYRYMPSVFRLKIMLGTLD
jgi:hypothetical protein